MSCARVRFTPKTHCFQLYLQENGSFTGDISTCMHTLLAGFVRLPFATVKWVAEAIGWEPERVKGFFKISRGNCYYYSPEEIRHYYEAIRNRCRSMNISFSVCYDSDKNYEIFRDMWANSRDCCNALENVPGFKKVYANCC